MSMHRTRSVLAESIKLLRRRSRELQTNYLQGEHNERRLKTLLRKLYDHKTHSSFLKNMLRNLKIQINEHDCSNVGEILNSQLEVMTKLTTGNLKEAEECINVASHLRYMRRSRSKRRKPKSSLKKSKWMFLSSLKMQNSVATTKEMNDNKNVLQPKVGTLSTLTSLNEKPCKKHIHRRRSVQSKQLDTKNLDFMKDSSIVSQKITTQNLPASRLKVKVYPREKTETPYTDLTQPDLTIAFGNIVVDKEEDQQGAWRKPHYTDSKILKGRVRKRTKNKRDSKLIKEFALRNTLPNLKMRSHRRVRKNCKKIEAESLQKVQSVQSEKESHSKNDLTKFSKTPTVNKRQHSSTYEKLKLAYRAESLQPTEKRSVLKRKDTSDESLAKYDMTVSKYFEIKSQFNPVLSASQISQTNSFSVAKPKAHSALSAKPSLRSLDGVSKDLIQPAISSMATTIINRLFEDKPIASDTPRFHKTIDATKMSANSFLGTISKMKPSDQINAVWNDLQGKYKEWCSSAKTPEDVQKFREFLKWRYIHNVQKVLHNHVKQFKMDVDGGRSETESRKSVTSSRVLRPHHQIPTNYGSLGVAKRASSTDLSQLRQTHDAFVRSQMESLRSRAFDKDVGQMELMIMNRQVPISEEEVEIFRKYTCDPQHYNVLILTFGKPISDEKYEEMLPVLEKNFQFISQQLVVLSRAKRVQKMKANIEIQRAEEEVTSKVSRESYHTDRTDFSEAYLQKRRDLWAAYIAKQPKTPTEILLAQVRYKKRMDQLAKKRDDREQRRLQEQRFHKRRRSLSALFRAPRQTHRERQAIEDIKEKLEVGKSRCSLTSLCQCSRCGVSWTQKCSEGSNDSLAGHICQNVEA
ncbi:uncharacterized protein LOC6540660 [Drosophila erecta]|uniref:Uncharacterized protein n=1 Tax=Drosophila erecta TaxID=7220 RepID=A0A0Q5WKP9_DROER|nr:uncharacterized protein LOC6540660 [Drosophila erecta]KQS70777.1 uncharacterized protein Dere_GG10554 [Drosophila erecta]